MYATAVLLGVLWAAADEDLSIETLKKAFEYDANTALDVKASVFLEKPGVKVFDVTYASPKGGRVTAFLATPTTAGPHAGVVFGHWGPGDRTEFLPEADLYARAGAVSLLVSYPWTRPEPWRKALRDVDDPEGDYQTFVQAVVDLRRGVDLLAGRSGVDPKRLAYVGHSFGAQWGAILAAVDPRLKGVVLMAGVPDQASIWRDGKDPGVVAYRRRTPPEKFNAFLKVTERTAAVRYVPHALSPLLFQFAKHERIFDRAAMERYAAAAPKGTPVLWYDTGHELNDFQSLLDRADWLRRKIGIRSIGPLGRNPTESK